MTSDNAPSSPGAMKAAAKAGSRWTLVQVGGARLMTFVVFLVLARLLSPEEFGLVAIATVFVALLQLLVEGGFGLALVQREELERGHLDTVFWVSIGTALLLACGLALAARPMATLYDQPLLAQLLPVLAIGLVLAGLGSTQRAQLQRGLRFGPLGIRAVVSNGVAGVVAIVLAVLGAGVWALVAQYLVLTAVQTTLLWVLTGWRPGLAVSRRHLADVLSFSRHTLGNQFLIFTNKRSDDFLIGAVLGPIPLGLYSVGYRLLTTLSDVITRTLDSVAFPVLSRLQSEPERLSRAYLTILKIGAALSFPGFLFFTIAATDAVEVVFGAKWLAAAPIMAVLAISGALQATLTITDSCLTATGRPRVVFRNGLVITLVQIAAFAIAAPFGIIWVAWALVIRTYLLAPLPVLSLVRAGVVDLRGWLRALRTPLLGSAVMLGLVAAVHAAMLPHTGPVLRLVAMALTGAITYLGMLWLLDRGLLRDMIGVLKPGRRGRGPTSPLLDDLPPKHPTEASTSAHRRSSPD